MTKKAVKVKQSVRNGKVVKAHTRTITFSPKALNIYNRAYDLFSRALEDDLAEDEKDEVTYAKGHDEEEEPDHTKYYSGNLSLIEKRILKAKKLANTAANRAKLQMAAQEYSEKAYLKKLGSIKIPSIHKRELLKLSETYKGSYRSPNEVLAYLRSTGGNTSMPISEELRKHIRK